MKMYKLVEKSTGRPLVEDGLHIVTYNPEEHHTKVFANNTSLLLKIEVEWREIV